MAILCSLAAAPAAAAAARTTVIGELERLAPPDYAAKRAAYEHAKDLVKRLRGVRRAELGGVVADLENMASRHQLTASRLGPLWLTLERNIQWWTTSPLLADGQRVGFPDSELVWQEYRGHGIQLQWLATFGKLNGLWTGGRRYDARAGRLIDEILPLASERAGGLAWEYLFPFDGQRPPWVSSLAQGTGLQALARAAIRLGRQADVLPAAQRGLGIFLTTPPEGVRVDADGGAHYLQYSGLPELRVLNGFIQSLVGLFDYAGLTGDPTARNLFAAGDAAARAEVPRFDTGAWSLYSRGSLTRESDLGYHRLLRDFLGQLCSRTGALEYCSAAQHFTGYLTIPPVLALLPSTLRAGREGRLRFKLSKIARLSVRVARGDKVVLARTLGAVGRGTRSLEWRVPRRTGEYMLTVSATDLAGNPAAVTGTVEVTRKRDS